MKISKEAVGAVAKKVNWAKVAKWGGLGLSLGATMLSGFAEKKQNEAYLDKLFNEKFANKN